jgi:hypothetical protein
MVKKKNKKCSNNDFVYLWFSYPKKAILRLSGEVILTLLTKHGLFPLSEYCVMRRSRIITKKPNGKDEYEVFNNDYYRRKGYFGSFDCELKDERDNTIKYDDVHSNICDE